MIISQRTWLNLVSLVNMLISYFTYTTASHSLKNMDTDSTTHGPTYTTELHSHMHNKHLDTRYAEWMLSDR